MHTAAGVGWRCLSWMLGRKRIWWLAGLFVCLYNVTIGWQVYQQHCEADTRARNRAAHLADMLAERIANDLDHIASSLEAIAVVWAALGSPRTALVSCQTLDAALRCPCPTGQRICAGRSIG